MAGSNVRAQQAATAALESKERSEALAQMHLTKILRAYILQMITGAWADNLQLLQQRQEHWEVLWQQRCVWGSCRGTRQAHVLLDCQQTRIHAVRKPTH